MGRQAFWIVAFCFVVMAAEKALAYPVQVEQSKVSWLTGAKRSRLMAFAPRAGGEWKRMPIQIDEVEDGAAIVFRNPQTSLPLRKGLAHPGKRDPFEGMFDEVHRIAVDESHFDACDDACVKAAEAQAQKLCPGGIASRSSLTRIQLDFSKKSGFIVECRKDVPAEFKTNVKFNGKTRTVTSDAFQYTYKDKKNILFENISAMPEKNAILNQGELQVFLKPKYVFNMHFAEKDIVSQITSISQGQMSTGLEMAFSLNVLTFKVNNQICCDVSFYKDSLYFPVMLDLPFEGNSFKEGSGLFYGIKYDGDLKKDVQLLAPKMGEKGDEQIASALIFKSKGKVLAISFPSKKTNEGGKVIPTLAYPDDMKKNGFPDIKSQFGLFYDVTSLQKGFHHFNVWFFFGDEKQMDLLTEYARYGVRFKASQI